MTAAWGYALARNTADTAIPLSEPMILQLFPAFALLGSDDSGSESDISRAAIETLEGAGRLLVVAILVPVGLCFAFEFKLFRQPGCLQGFETLKM